MIDKVRVVNDRAIDKTLTLGEVSDGVVIRVITGLGPVKADLITSQRTQGRGVSYNGNTVGARNIVFTLGLHRYAGKSIEAVRSEVYNYFPVGEPVFLEFITTDGYWRNTEGIVETVEPDIFSKDPTLNVSVVCLDSAFSGDPYNVMVNPGSVGSVFTYHGRIATGITIEIEPVGNYIPGSLNGEFAFYQDTNNSIPREFYIHDFDLASLTGSRLKLGDRIQIRTMAGFKTAELIRGTARYNIFPAVKIDNGFFPKEENWPLLRPEELTAFRYAHTSYDPAMLNVSATWVELIEGL